MKTVTLFHGTRDARLGSFTPEGIGRGGDVNSALGVFFCETPEACVRYADPDYGITGKLSGRGHVLMAEVELADAFVEGRISDFFGLADDDDPTDGLGKTRQDFTEARSDLLRRGYDCVVTDGCMDENAGIWVVLDPARIRSVRKISTAEALDMADGFVPDYDHVSMGGDGSLFPAPEVAAAPGPR